MKAHTELCSSLLAIRLVVHMSCPLKQEPAFDFSCFSLISPAVSCQHDLLLISLSYPLLKVAGVR